MTEMPKNEYRSDQNLFELHPQDIKYLLIEGN
jgi:hypothetical protein